MFKKKTPVLKLFEEKGLVKVCAPMVRYSKLQFRNLVKLYDCDLVYTPMILADSFCESEKARQNEFTTNCLDTPLIAQFAANSSEHFLEATKLIYPYCDGIDLNCGCPQRWAKEIGIGCELLKQPQLIYDIVKQCRNVVDESFTVSVKIRLLHNIRDTVEFVRQLEKCGVSFVTVHARIPEQSVGEINRTDLKIIKESCNIPIIGNGGLTNVQECNELQKQTGCDGVMVANAILSNPALFSGYSATPMDCIQNWIDICYNSILTEETYKSELENPSQHIPERPNSLTFQCFHHHLVFMLGKLLKKKQRQYFNNLRTFREALSFINNTFGITPRLFPLEKFYKYSLSCINYLDSQESTMSIKRKSSKFVAHDAYSNGKYFESRFESDEDFDCDWSNIFLDRT